MFSLLGMVESNPSSLLRTNMKCEHVEDVAACITKGVHAKRILEPLDAGMIRTMAFVNYWNFLGWLLFSKKKLLTITVNDSYFSSLATLILGFARRASNIMRRFRLVLSDTCLLWDDDSRAWPDWKKCEIAPPMAPISRACFESFDE